MTARITDSCLNDTIKHSKFCSTPQKHPAAKVAVWNAMVENSCSLGLNFRETELMQYRNPVGFGPSLNT